MPYAIDSKKRKFERILDSLTDHSSSQTRVSLATRNTSTNTPNASTVNSGLSKRPRVEAGGDVQRSAQASTASLTTHYLPSSRLAFLERLETFRQVTKWHIPSTSVISAVQWAKRGWVCQDTDTVTCPGCKERLHVDVELDLHTAEEHEANAEVNDHEDGEDSMEVADAISQGLLKRYQDMIVSAHTESCPWRRRGCDSSIQRIEGLLNVPIALDGIQRRYQGIIEDQSDIPEVVSISNAEHYNIDEDELRKIRLGDEEAIPNIHAVRLAVCGWQRKDTDIVECRHCFRSLGLWLYRGPEPTVEHLDAIDSHLEYCPWRSEIAQDTELALPGMKGDALAEKRSGWFLNYLAIAKRNNKGRKPVPSDARQITDEMSDEDTQPPQTPEQREMKMKDLVKRIRDLKRPFNVKALLKRKEKASV